MKALLSGSFDPPTLGHLDIIVRGAHLCDQLYVAVAVNTRKHNGLFSIAERVLLLRELTASIKHVEVVSFSGLVIEFANANGVDFLFRGLRTAADLEHEFEMALANRKMSGIETLFLMADERHAHISSTLIREIAQSGRHLERFVPELVAQAIYKRSTNPEITQRDP